MKTFLIAATITVGAMLIGLGAGGGAVTALYEEGILRGSTPTDFQRVPD